MLEEGTALQGGLPAPLLSRWASSPGLGCPALGFVNPLEPGVRTPGFDALLLPWRDLLQSRLRGLVFSSVLRVTSQLKQNSFSPSPLFFGDLIYLYGHGTQPVVF